MRKYLLLSVFLIAEPALAQDAVALKAALCSNIPDSLQRLACFDQAFPKQKEMSAPAQPQEPDKQISNWEITEEKSALDDSATIRAVLSPVDVSYTGIGEGQMMFVLRCQEKTTSALFFTNMFMTEETVPVTIRIGDKPATKSSWNRSSNYRAVGLWSGQQAIPFLKTLLTGDRLVVRIEEKDRIDAEFKLGDVASVVEKISSACTWPLSKAN